MTGYIDWSNPNYVERCLLDTIVKVRMAGYQGPVYRAGLVNRVNPKTMTIVVSFTDKTCLELNEDGIDFNNVRLGYSPKGRYLARIALRNDWRQGLRLRNLREIRGWTETIVNSTTLGELEAIFNSDYKLSVEDVIKGDVPLRKLNCNSPSPVSRDVAFFKIYDDTFAVFHRGLLSGVYTSKVGLNLGPLKFLKERMEGLGLPVVRFDVGQGAMYEETMRGVGRFDFSHTKRLLSSLINPMAEQRPSHDDVVRILGEFRAVVEEE